MRRHSSLLPPPNTACARVHAWRRCAQRNAWHAQLSRDRDMAERAHSFFFAHVLAHLDRCRLLSHLKVC